MLIVIFVPYDFNSVIINFNSRYIFRLVMKNWGLGFQGTGRKDDVVGTVNQGMGEFANNTRENFRSGLGLMKEDIKLSIMETLASEMMMAGVIKIYGDELVFGAEMSQEGRTGKILWIAVGITSNIYWAMMAGGHFFNKIIQFGKSRDKLWTSA